MHNEIEFNYFYKMFRQEYRKYVLDIQRMKPENNEDLNELFDVYLYNDLTREEQISVFDKSLWDICSNYISLSNSSITVLPNHSLELLYLILENNEKNIYQKSFLQSLQFIFQDYFQLVRKGHPILFSSETNATPSLQITLNSSFKIIQFDFINMDLVEQDKTILRILSLEKNNKIGPIPNVEYIYRKDI